MSKDSSNVPNLTAAQAASVSQWTLENDYPGNSVVHSPTNRSVTGIATQKPGSGEIAKYESYGPEGIRGPSLE